MLWKRPGFTAMAVVALALGVGANTAIFSVVNAVLLRPLPYSEPERAVVVWLKGAEAAGGDRVPMSVMDLLDWRARNEVFESVGAFTGGQVSYTGGEAPEQIPGAQATADFFDTLGARPRLGRTFKPEDERPDAERVAVVSDGFWRRRMGADPAALGRVLTLDGRQYTVVGVMPEGFDFPTQDMEVWTAFQVRPPSRRGPYFLTGLARVRAGVTLEQARAALNAMPDPEHQGNPPQGERFNMLTVNDYLVGDVRPALLVLLGAVGLVLLIACANVANLLLARAASREREIAVRAALGASRWRLARQLLTESVLLGAAGGFAGLLLSVWGVDALLALSPEGIHRLREAHIDGRVLLFTLGVSLLSGVAFGLAPALQGAGADLNETLKEGGARGSTEGRGRRRMRDALVVAEIALALMLLVGAGLLLKSFTRLQNVESGVRAERVLTMQVSLPRARYEEGPKRVEFFRQLLERVRAVPGVESAAATTSLPPDLLTASDNFSVEGRPEPPGGELPVADLLSVTPEYFRALGVPVVRGRLFTDADREGTPPVCVVNETLARQFFAGEDPVGKRLKQGGSDRPGNQFMEIVGVVGDVRYEGLHAKVQPAFYLPYQQSPWFDMSLVVRTNVSEPRTLAAAVSKEVWALDRDLPVARVATMEELMSRSVAQPRFRTLLVAVFSCVALLLAAVGVYGVMSYAVVRRTHEIGVRVALGARGRDVLRLVVGHGLRLVLAGIGCGLAGALLLTRVMEGMLYGVSAADPATYAVVALLLASVALLACFIPARRATKVDPMVALRYE
jgi:putative ABC transport system permease protein